MTSNEEREHTLDEAYAIQMILYDWGIKEELDPYYYDLVHGLLYDLTYERLFTLARAIVDRQSRLMGAPAEGDYEQPNQETP